MSFNYNTAHALVDFAVSGNRYAANMVLFNLDHCNSTAQSMASVNDAEYNRRIDYIAAIAHA